MDIKYLITGTGRCGTVYLAKLLNLAGIPCSHENIFTTNGIGLPNHNSTVAQREGVPDQGVICAESSMYAAPFVDAYNWKVVHVTRHPLKVIRSFVSDLRYFTDDWESREDWVRKSHSYFKEHIPEIMKQNGPINRAAYFYTHWNSLIEKTSNEYLHHRIEDDPQVVLDFLGARQTKLEDTLCNSFSKRHVIAEDFQWEDIPKASRQELKQAAKKYGY